MAINGAIDFKTGRAPGFQSFGNLKGGGDAPTRIFLHHIRDDVNKVLANVRGELAWMPGSLFAVAFAFAFGIATGERHFASHSVIQGAAQGIDVTGRFDAARVIDLLGRQVISGADHLARSRIIIQAHAPCRQTDV